MNKVRNIIDRIKVDNKLLTALGSAVVTWALAKYAAGLDPNISAALSALIAGGVGYQTPNEGTDLRQGNFDNGNPEIPHDTGELGPKEVA